ncbi:hypothetical protein MRX96_014208 [Rhipicephalus microplus]
MAGVSTKNESRGCGGLRLTVTTPNVPRSVPGIVDGGASVLRKRSQSCAFPIPVVVATVVLEKCCGDSWMTHQSMKYVVTPGFHTITAGKRRKGADMMKPLPASGKGSFGRASGRC